MRTKAPMVMATFLGLMMVTAGCLTDDGGNGDDGNGDLPHEGTTEGFLFPDIRLETVGIGENRIHQLEADLIVVQVVASASIDDIRLQKTHFGPIRDRFSNTTEYYITVVADPDTTTAELEALESDHNIDLPSIARGDIVDTLSVKRYPTVFMLDERKVIFLRNDGQVGQGKMIQAIEDHWGVPPAVETGLEPGDVPPDLLWIDMDGQVGWVDNYWDHVLIINVWENECPFCILLMEELHQVYLNYSHLNFEIVSIDHNPEDSEQIVRNVREEYNATWKFAIDSDNIQSRYDIWREPVIFLIDKDGVIRWTNIGLVDSSIIAGEVEKLI